MNALARSAAPSRPALRYLGGKWRLAPWIIRHLPPHRVYIEPWGGAASVLLRKPRTYAEVYNDLDGDVVHLFRVLRDPDLAEQLIRAVALTPFARDEFVLSYEATDEPIERARRLVARSFMGHGATATGKRTTTGFRADSNRSGTTPSRDWLNLPPALMQITERLQGVVIENRPALDIIARFSTEDALIYADPPYVQSTRSGKRVRGDLECSYVHEMTDADHEAMLQALIATPAMVVLSGYDNEIYNDCLPGWDKVSVRAYADGARERLEMIWLNGAATHAHGLLGQMR